MPNQDLRFRRKVVTSGEPQPKNRLALILSVAAAAVILPALAYTALHPANVSNTVQQIARHFPAQIKDIHIAVRAAREAPSPSPSPAATASAAAAPSAKPVQTKPADALAAAHLAHLKRAHQLALAARTRKPASSEQPASASDLSVTSTARSTRAGQSPAPVAAVSTPTPTPAQVAAAGPPQVPISEATPVYAPEIVVDARFTREVHPDYPEVAKQESAQGTAVILATIGPNGSVISARVDQSTGNRLLDSAALQAARASGFEPPKINGKPATETYRLIYTFSL